MRFFVQCRPMGKSRPRFTKRGATYTPGKTLEGERMIRCALLSECAKKRIQVPVIHRPAAVGVTIDVCLPIPASWSKALQSRARDGLVPATKKPDADNYAKIVLDALNGVAWDDDSQVITLTVRKLYSPGEPGFSIDYDEVSCG